MTTPTPEALARQIVGDWEGQLTIPVSQMAKLDLEQRIYAALTESGRPISPSWRTSSAQAREIERATWEAAAPWLRHLDACNRYKRGPECDCGLYAARAAARGGT